MNPSLGLRAAGHILRALNSTGGEDDQTLRRVMWATTGFFIALLLLISCVLSILAAPFEYTGLLGDFQSRYSYLVQSAAGVTEPGDLAVAEEYASVTENMESGWRQDVIRTGLTLVGRVPYFWGGKSAPGWNEAWGTMRLVTAEGSRSSGTYRPYGLDCSGYVDWVFETAGVGSLLAGGTSYQWEASEPITAADLQPGDLAFLQPPSASGVNHVGIYVGKNGSGKNLYLHCSSGADGVALNDYGGFRYFRRAALMNRLG